MNVYTVEEIRQLERKTMKHKNETEAQLMQTAGFLLTKDFIARMKPSFDDKITIFAGVGNNGGDALVMANELRQMGFHLQIFVIGSMEKASDSFRYYYDQVGNVNIIDDELSLDRYQQLIFDSNILIDGIFGIGLSKPIIGYRRTLIQYINESNTNVYSIDIPSGIHPDSGCSTGIAVKANCTGIIGAYKVGNLLHDAMDFHGETKVLDIGLIMDQDEKKKEIELSSYSLTPQVRKHQSNKYTYGLGIFLGGSESMMGSIQMSAYAALRSGLGICKIISSASNKPFTQFYPELMIGEHTEQTIDILKKAKTIVFGPGMNEDEQYRTSLDWILYHSTIPTVIDASGLSYLKQQKPNNPNVVLTPHLGELSRMTKIDSKEIMNTTLEALKTWTDLGFSVLLKGPCNVLATPDKTYFIPVNNTGFATAGSGDVLSGIIAANLVNKEFTKGILDGIYIHTKAGNLARERWTEISMTASDILDEIPFVFKEEQHV